MKNNTYKYYSIHNLLTVKTNLDIGVPKYFSINEKNLKSDFEANIEIVRENFEVVELQNKVTRSRNYFYWNNNSALFLDYAVPYASAKLLIDNLNKKTKIKITKFLSKFGRVELPSFNSLLDLKLIQKDFTLLHSGCINYKGQCLLIIASRDTGKTSTVLSLFDGEDFKFMSDDLTIISKSGIAYSYPEKVGVTPHTLTGSVISPYSKSNFIKRKLTKYHSLTLLFGRFFDLEVTERKEIPRNLIVDKGMIDKVFILKGGNEKTVKLISTQTAVEKILSATLGLINPSKSYLLNFYSCICDFNLYDLIFEKKKIIEEAIKEVECYEICSNNVSDYHKEIRKILK